MWCGRGKDTQKWTCTNMLGVNTDLPLIFMHSCTLSWRKAICYQSNHGHLASLSSIRVGLHFCSLILAIEAQKNWWHKQIKQIYLRFVLTFTFVGMGFSIFMKKKRKKKKIRIFFSEIYKQVIVRQWRCNWGTLLQWGYENTDVYATEIGIAFLCSE